MSSIILGTDNASYHADRSRLSSSSLKLLLADPGAFYQKYVVGGVPEEQKDVFDEGSLVHSLILEPETVVERYAIYPGMRKQGAEWEAFKSNNPGKVHLSAPQMMRCEKLCKAHEAVHLSTSLLENTLKEHNLLAEFMGVALKARADYINVEKGYIGDVKTSSMPTDPDIFRGTVSQYAYDLSAALYCLIAEEVYKKRFDFYWNVLSKADSGVGVYKMSVATRATGMEKVIRALHMYKLCIKTGKWETGLTSELESDIIEI